MYYDAAETVRERDDVGMVDAMTSDDDELTKLMADLKADRPIQAHASIRTGGSEADALVAVRQIRSANNNSKGLTPSNNSYRDPNIASFGQFKLKGSPSPLRAELIAIVRELHQDWCEDWCAGAAKLSQAQLVTKVQECVLMLSETAQLTSVTVTDAWQGLLPKLKARIEELDDVDAAPIDPAEASVLESLRKSESAKGDNSTKKHGSFTSLAEIQVANLNAEQRDTLLLHYGETASTVPSTQDGRTARLLALLPPNPVKEAERAMGHASKATQGRIQSYVRHFGHLLRVVNQLFGMDVGSCHFLSFPDIS